MNSQAALRSHKVRASRIPANLLGALRGVNGELLEGLRRSFLSGRQIQPVPLNIGRRIAVMSDEQIDHCARCGLLLVDLRFLHKAYTSEGVGQAEADYELDSTMPANSWLSPVQFVSLAHSTLMTAWHMCQWDIDAAAVLLGVEPTFAHALAQVEPLEISQVARKFGHLVLPRWHAREDVWHDLLSLGVGDSRVAINLAVRGLQLSGALYGGRVLDRPAISRQFGRKLRPNPSLPAVRT